MKRNKRISKQRQYGRLSIAITLLVFAFIVALNVLVSVLSDRSGAYIDLTSEKIYEISEDSAERLEALDQDVTLTMLEDRSTVETASEYTTLVYHVLQQYEKNSPHISLQFVDLVENPTFINQYPDFDLNAYDTVVACGEHVSVIPFNDMFSYAASGYQSSISSSRAEQMITNAISYVTSGRSTKVVLLTGYGDTSPDALLSLIQDSNGTVVTQSLVTEAIDPDADIAILYDTRRDPDEASLAKLEAWLENSGDRGKRLLVFSNPYYTELDNLNAFLYEWNLEVNSGLVVDESDSHFYSVPYCPIASYGDSAITDPLKNSTSPTVMMLCSALTSPDIANDSHLVTPLLTFSDASAILPLDASDAEDAEPSPNAAGMLLSESLPSETTRETSAILLCGSTECLSSAILNGETFSNYRLMAGILEELGDAPPMISIPSKDLTEAVHNMPRGQIVLCIVIFLAVIPAAILAAGIWVWIRRRHG